MNTWKPVCKQEEKEIEKLNDDDILSNTDSESEDDSSDGSEELKETKKELEEENFTNENLQEENIKGEDNLQEEDNFEEEDLKGDNNSEEDEKEEECTKEGEELKDEGSNEDEIEEKNIEEVNIKSETNKLKETNDLQPSESPKIEKLKKHNKRKNKKDNNEEEDYKKDIKDIKKMSLKEKVDYINNFNPQLRPMGKIVHILKSPLRSEYFIVGMAATRILEKNKKNKARKFPQKDKEAIYIKPTIKHYMKMDVVDQSLITKEDPDEYYLCQYVSWTADRKVPLGKIIRRLGIAGTVDSETLRVLIGFNILPKELPEEAAEELSVISKVLDPFTGDIVITEEEKSKRVDLRNKRIFTTDNDDTKDIDDAVHVEKIADNVYELGVHIADVGHYVREGTMLDEQAKAKATSVYLIHKTYPMFPEVLTNEICSLNPNVNRLAFSITFRVDSNGQIIRDYEPKIFKSVIRSKSKMSYSLFQGILDGNVKSNDDLPEDHKVHGKLINNDRMFI